jgi:hypothetical protein
LGECGAVKEEEGEMADLRLVSTRNRPFKPLVEAASANELRLMEAGIRRTEQRLQEVENVFYEECPFCGEKVISPEISEVLFRKIENQDFSRADNYRPGLGRNLRVTKRQGSGVRTNGIG